MRVCRGPECGERHGSRSLYEAFRRTIAERDLGATVELGWQSCFGRCTQGPNVLVREVVGEVTPVGEAPEASSPGDSRAPATALYNGVNVADVTALVEEHVERGEVVRRLVRAPSAFRKVPE